MDTNKHEFFSRGIVSRWWRGSQESRPGTGQFLRTVANSCGAAMEGSPRRQPWVAVLAIGAAKRRKKILAGRNSVPLTGLVVMAHFSPQLAPWATLFRHPVAAGLRHHRPT